ncbi:MAG: trypsin-like peptidase domain-containing protein [Gemmatimonadota bacterium]|nr:trypsin-like peptidase domain-containing protein [Gemmatimonadota bacterium]
MQRGGTMGWWERFRAVGVGGVVAVAIAVPGLSLRIAPLAGQTPLEEASVDLEELAATATAAVVLVEVKIGDDSRQGSGFIVDPDGVILTNYHVVRGATSARVRLASGDVYEHIQLLAQDERRDIAVLKIPGFGLPALDLGNSDAVRIGMTAIAIGSPLGLENTVSTGIVSGRRQEPEGFQLLQITASASSGSSGGPVLTRDGRVIGIAASQIRRGQNLNFAVPINYARGMLADTDREAIAVYSPSPSEPVREAMDMAAADDRVNGGLRFDLEALADGHQLDLEARDLSGGTRTTRVTVRRLEDIFGRESKLERYMESETAVRQGTPGPAIATRRERSRTIVTAEGLRPVSTRGQIEWRVEGGWRRASYDLRFEDGTVVGTIQDSAGVVTPVEREIPEGILLREMTDLAFGMLVAEPLIGRSVEFVTFDPWTAQVTADRYDVRWNTTIRAGGEERDALVVDIVSGLDNDRVHFTVEVPRTMLRRRSDRDGVVEEVVRVYSIPPPGDGGS